MRSLLHCLVALPLFFAGCGSGGPDGIAKSTLDTMTELADTVESAKDDASAASAAAKADKLGSRLKDLDQQGKALNLSREEQEKIAKKYGEDFRKVESRLTGALLKMMKDAPAHYQQINGTLNKHGLGLKAFSKVGQGIDSSGK